MLTFHLILVIVCHTQSCSGNPERNTSISFDSAVAHIYKLHNQFRHKMFQVLGTVKSVQLVLTVNLTLVQRDASVIPALCYNLLVLSYFTEKIRVNIPS